MAYRRFTERKNRGAAVNLDVRVTGTLEPVEDDDTKPSIRGKNITIPSALQILTFFVGLLMTVVFGVKAT
jgi:hypothetical protein